MSFFRFEVPSPRGEADAVIEVIQYSLMPPRREAFTRLKQRRAADIYRATQALGDYVARQNIADIVLLDKSARPVWPGLSEYWRLAYADRARPDIHFLNPEMLDSRDLPRPLAPLYERVARDRAGQELLDSNNSLLSHRDAPVLVFDTCMHSGRTMKSVTDLLGDLDFKDVRVGTFTQTVADSECSVDVDFRYTDDPDMLMCRPYGLDDGLEKPSNSIYVAPHGLFYHMADLAFTRAENRALIAEQHALAQSSVAGGL